MSTVIYNAQIWNWSEYDLQNCRNPQPKFDGNIIPDSWIHVGEGTLKNIGKGIIPEELMNLRKINAMNKLILPGLIDSHIHVLLLGESHYYLDLSNCFSIEELKLALDTHSQKYPDLPWIIGFNWDQTSFGRYPTRHDLDSIISGRPVFLWRACWHIGVANSKALILANLLSHVDTISSTKNQRDYHFQIEGGQVDLEECGLPSGILRERAVEPLTKAMGEKTFVEKKKFILEGLAQCLRSGLTSVQTNDESCYNVYQQLNKLQPKQHQVVPSDLENGFLPPPPPSSSSSSSPSSSPPSSSSSSSSSSSLEDDENQSKTKNYSLPIRVFLTPTYEDLHRLPTEGGIHGLPPLRPVSLSSSSPIPISAFSGPKDDEMLCVERIKIFSDGSLGAQTAALRHPSSPAPPVKAFSEGNSDRENLLLDQSSTQTQASGLLIHSSQKLRDMLSEAKGLGYRAEVHAIGDAAADQVISAMEAAGLEPSDRPLLTHCQILGADLIERMKTGGIIANIQPSFVPTDMRWVMERLTDPEQLRHAYAWRSLMQAGVHVAGGSDAPVECCRPGLGLFDAMFRMGPRGNADPQPFHPEERLSFSEALWIYTLGGSFAMGCEEKLGAIHQGYLADLVFVDPMVVENPLLLSSLEPDLVMVNGDVKYLDPRSPIIFQSDEGHYSFLNLDTAVPNPSNLSGPFIPGKGGRPLACGFGCTCSIQFCGEIGKPISQLNIKD